MGRHEMQGGGGRGEDRSREMSYMDRDLQAVLEPGFRGEG